MEKIVLKVAARTSALSRAQAKEVLAELQVFSPGIEFEETFLKTTGDVDQKTSLRSLEKTDFFTKEIDAMILNKTCGIAIHSAKDLPDPLPEGLELIALTKGLDPSDSLVLKKGTSLSSLKPGALIATSSLRREAAVLQLRPDFKFRDLRGTIQQIIYIIVLGVSV